MYQPTLDSARIPLIRLAWFPDSVALSPDLQRNLIREGGEENLICRVNQGTFAPSVLHVLSRRKSKPAQVKGNLTAIHNA